MARDQVTVMAALGFDRFQVVGHDRGARVAHRMALDHEEAVLRLALLDIVPTLTLFETVNQKVAEGSRSEEHTSELQSLMRNSFAVFYLKKKKLTLIYNIH